MLRRVRPDITINIPWCPAHKVVTENEKADERVKLTAVEPEGSGGRSKVCAERKAQQKNLSSEAGRKRGGARSSLRYKSFSAYKSREVENSAGIHIHTSPTPCGAYPTTSS